MDPPYRVETERLVVRCWDPRDAPLLKEAVDSSLDHLRPWMPWAEHEPQPLAEKVQLLRRFRGQFDVGQDFVYGIFPADGSEVIGGSGLHTRVGSAAFEIGYWVRASRIGLGFATEASAARTRVAFEVCRVDRVEIRVDARNVRSLAVPRRLGFTEEATLRRRLPAGDAEMRDAVVFSLFAADFPASPAAGASLAAHDAAGARVL
ncbi:MAG: GNAT family N-acetyltransferase [Gaiellaceae bacterium]